jgi:hypothetical protein
MSMPQSMQTPGSSQEPEASWAATLEATTKVSAVLAAAGYIATRSHFNTLGLAMTESLGLERYLETAWLLVQDLALRAVPVALLFLLVQQLGKQVQRRVLPRLQRWFKRPNLGTAPVDLLLLCLLELGVVAWFLKWVRDSHRIDLAMGPLSTSQGYATPLPTFLFETALVLLVLGFPLLRKQAPFQTVTGLHQVTWVVLLIITPVIYGVVVHPDKYPLARITVDPAPVCGLLVLQGPESVSLWSVENGYARTVRWKLDDVKKIEVGPVSSLTGLLAAMTAETKPLVPSTAGLCEQF